jgi:hydrogenase maturation protease
VTCCVIGVGNELRGDDGAGLEAIRLIRRARIQTAPEPIALRVWAGEPVGLIELWRGSPAVVLVDTMRSGAPPGAIRRLDPARGPLPVRLRGSCTTHAAGLEEVIELARVLDRLPPRLIVYAIEGRRFDAGADLSDPVRAALPALVRGVVAEVRRLAPPAVTPGSAGG